MSRLYRMDMQVEKEKISDDEFDTLKRIFKDQWENDKGFKVKVENSEIAIFSSESCLYGGEEESEAHARIRDLIKNEIGNCQVKTRWVYLEDLPSEEFID